MRKLLLLMLLLTEFGIKSLAQAPIEGNWYSSDKKDKIWFYLAKDGNYYGKIVWMAEPNRRGAPKMDDNNPDESKRTIPSMNLILFKKFKKGENDHYTGGTAYDPKNGKTYDCRIIYEDNKLYIRGYVLGMTWLGRTEVFTKAEP